MTDEELDRIKRAEEIQRYTENRCEALEKENADLKIYNEKLLTSEIEKHNKVVELESRLTKAVKLLKRCYDDYVYLPPLRTDIEEFLEEV